MGYIKRILFLTSFILMTFSIIPLAHSKSYSYDLVNVDIYLQQNGSAYVKQERDYNFQGSFSYAYIDFLKKGSTGIKILGVKDMDSQLPVGYDVSEESDSVKVTWYYSANSEVRRFLIEYTIDGAVKRYEDVAEFYWKVIEDSHEPINNLDINIHLPAQSPDLFKVFVHSSASPGEIKFSDQFSDSSVSMKNIPGNTFVETRVLTSPAIFPSILQTNGKMYENILNEEKGNFLIYGVSGFFSSFLFLAILIAVPIVFFIFLYVKYGREPKVDYDLTYEHEPPSDIPPMALSNLMEGEEVTADIKREAMGILATIFDLARRGYIEIRESKKRTMLGLHESKEQIFSLTKKGIDVEERKKLLPFENLIISFIFSCGSNRQEVTSSEISEYCKKSHYDVKKKIEDIDKSSREWFEKNYFKITDEKSSKMNKISIYFLIGFSVLVGLYLFFFVGFSRLVFQIYLIASILIYGILLRTNPISRRTYESALEVKRWKAFKKFESDFSAMKDAPAVLLHIWDKYLVYAIALGVAKELLENIKKLSIERNVPISSVAWYNVGMPMKAGTMDIGGMSSFIDSLSGTISSLSSSTSVGGGFSGGGGGGGGGGGSGAG